MNQRMTADEFRAQHAQKSEYGGYRTVATRIVPLNPDYDEKELTVMVKRILNAHGWHEPAHKVGTTHSYFYCTDQRRRSGVTEGLPDMWVQLPDSRAHVGVELKTPKGKLRPLQQVAYEGGGIEIWRTPQQAWDWCELMLAAREG